MNQCRFIKSLSQNSFELRVSSRSHPEMVSSSGLSAVAPGHTSKPLVVKHSRLTPSENSHSQTNFGIGSKPSAALLRRGSTGSTALSSRLAENSMKAELKTSSRKNGSTS